MDTTKKGIDIIIGLIPILIIFSFVFFTNEFEETSQSILGKIVAITIILLYTSIDKVAGLFVCLLVVFYYQNLFIKLFLKKQDTLSNNTENLIIDTPQNEFRKENCNMNGELMYKDMNIRSDIADLVFPEVNFKSDKCNPCSQSCSFSIIESKITTEEKMKPISSSLPIFFV